MFEDGTVKEIYKIWGDSERDFKTDHNLNLHFRGIDVASINEYEQKVLHWLNQPTSSFSLPSDLFLLTPQVESFTESDGREDEGENLANTVTEAKDRETELDSFDISSPNPATELGTRLSEVAKSTVIALFPFHFLLYNLIPIDSHCLCYS